MLKLMLKRWSAPLVLAMIASIWPLNVGAAEPGGWTMAKMSVDEITNHDEYVSAQKNKMLIYSFRRGQGGGPRYFIQGGLHGNEKQTSHFVIWLMKRLQSNRGPLSRLPAGTEIDFLPFANPDQYGKSRYNSMQVNLNRNFEILWGMSSEPNGKEPHSEPETKAIAALMKARKYVAAADIHGYVNWVVAPSHPKYFQNVSGHKKQIYAQWIRALKRGIALLPGYEFKTAGSLGDGGAFEDWAFWSNDTLSLCLEMRQATKDSQKRNKEFRKYEHFLANMLEQASQIPTQLYVSKTTLKAKKLIGNVKESKKSGEPSF